MPDRITLNSQAYSTLVLGVDSFVDFPVETSVCIEGMVQYLT